MPRRLFDWNSPELWLSEIELYASHILTTRIKLKIASTKPKCWSDDFDWIPRAYVIEDFTEALSAFYSHVCAFHACRPRDVATYMRQGLRIQEPDVLVQQFYEIYSDVPKCSLDRVVANHLARTESERGKLWVVLSPADFVKDCGHYLIQGSEYLMALAATLCKIAPGIEDYRSRLRNVGIPTIFEANIPIECFANYQMCLLARNVLSAWGQKVARRDLGMSCNPCLEVVQTVGPENIKGHTHPQNICDPHRGFAIYLNAQLRCPNCAD